MSKLTVHDILGTVEGLTKFSKTLVEAAQGRVIESRGQTGVLADPVALAEMAVWLQEAADELKELIPDGPLVALSASNRRQATLVRVTSVNASDGAVKAVLPGWNPDEEFIISGVPAHILTALEAANPSDPDPARVTAWVNLGASSAEELEFSDWELP